MADAAEALRVAQARAQSLIDFASGQLQLMQGSDPASANLAAGKVLELVHDFGRANVSYDAAVSEGAGLEARARGVMNLVKGGAAGEAQQRAQAIVGENDRATFPNLITEEPISVYQLVAAAHRGQGNEEAALGSLQAAADLKDEFATANLSLTTSDALPRFLEVPSSAGGSVSR